MTDRANEKGQVWGHLVLILSDDEVLVYEMALIKVTDSIRQAT